MMKPLAGKAGMVLTSILNFWGGNVISHAREPIKRHFHELDSHLFTGASVAGRTSTSPPVE